MRYPPLRPMSHIGEAPLSLEQEEIWYTWPLPPDSVAYNHPLLLWADGPFDRAAWDRALAATIARHDALRTRFARDGSGRWRQLIGEAFVPEITWNDLSSVDADRREAEWERLISAEVERPFDVGGRLVRGVGARLHDDLHGVLLVLPRALVDCWASGILERELVALYGDPATLLPEPALQYPDYALWQQEWWNGPQRDRLLDHWRAELVGWQPLRLPADRPPAAAFDAVGDIVTWRLEAGPAAALMDLANRERTSPFVVLAAAYAAVLGEWAGQPDVLFATTLGGRTVAALSDVVGLFANTVLLRAELDAEPTFRSLLTAMRRRVIRAFAHQQMPFGKVVAELAPVRDTRRPPLTGALLSHQEFVDPATLSPAPPGPLRAGYRDLAGGMREARRRAARCTLYDLELHTIVNAGRVAGLFEYRTQLFDAPTIEKLARGFEASLGRYVSDPDAPLRA